MKLVSYLSVLILSTIFLSGCNSSNKTTDAPVQGVFHAIEPDDVAAYVAEFSEGYERTEFLLDGVEQEFRFVDSDQESNVMITEVVA